MRKMTGQDIRQAGEFKLRETCNAVIMDFSQSEDHSSIVKISIDIEVPDRLKGSPSKFVEHLTSVIAWLSRNIVNGFVEVDISMGVNVGSNISLEIGVSGRDSDGGLQSLRGISHDGGAEIRDRLNKGIKTLSVPENCNLRFRVDERSIRICYNESFFRYQEADSSEGLMFRDKHVLLVEDNEINAMVFASFMEDWGITSAVAKNGSDAVDICRKEKFDLILMDIHMPVMNGIEATSVIRTFLPHIAIVALTASSLEDDVREAFKAGVSGYLRKPVTSAQLFRVIAEHIA